MESYAGLVCPSRPPILQHGIGIVEHRPLLEESIESELSQWMGDFGLEDLAKKLVQIHSVQLFRLLLNRDHPLFR